MSPQPVSSQAPHEAAADSDLERLTDLLGKPIAFHPALVRVGGSAAAGMMLSRLVYWAQRTKNADGWIYKTENQWADEVGLLPKEQRRARKELKARGLIEEKRGMFNQLNFRPCCARLLALMSGEATYETSSGGIAKRTQNLRRGRTVAAQEVRQQEPGAVVSILGFREANSPKDGELDSRKSGVQLPESRASSSPKIGEPVSRKSGVSTQVLHTTTTSFTTHTRAPEAPAQQASVCMKSGFSFDERRQYAENNFDRFGNKLGAGWLKTSANGSYDELIADWRDRQGAAGSNRRQHGNAATRTPDPSCPLCLGTGKEAVKDASGRTVAVKPSCGCKRASEGARVAV